MDDDHQILTDHDLQDDIMIHPATPNITHPHRPQDLDLHVENHHQNLLIRIVHLVLNSTQMSPDQDHQDLAKASPHLTVDHRHNTHHLRRTWNELQTVS